MRCGKAVLGLSVLALPTFVSAQTPEVLLEEGSTILGMGSVNIIDANRTLRITDSRMWTVLVVTNGPPAAQDGAILRSGFLTLRESMPTQPTGAQIINFDALDINVRGDMALALRTRGPSPDTNLKEALTWNLKVIAKEAEPVLATSPFLAAGARYDTFDIVRINDQGTILTAGDALAPTRKDLMLKFQVDALGNVLSSTVFAVDSQTIPGMGGAVIGNFGAAESNYAMNNKGDVLCYVLTNGGNAIVLNMDTPVAQEFTPTSVPGRDWSVLSNSRIALNDFGDFVISGITSGSTNTYLMEKNGEKFAQQGDVIPAFSSQPIGGASNAPILLGNNGDVFWRAVETGSATSEAFMRNYEPIMRRGDVLEDGRVITKLEVHDACFAISNNGRFFVGAVDVASADALVFIDFGLVLPLPGCVGNPGKLALDSGAARVGENMVFSMDDGNVNGALCRINFSTRRSLPSSECGLNTPWGEWMISGQHRVGSLFPPPWNGSSPSLVGTTVPADPVLIDAVFFAQGVFRKPGTANITFTNALRIEIGAP